MDQKDWKILKILHEEKNITKTAEKLFVSQPSLSYRLKKLEREVGTDIIFKTKTGIEFTSEGEYLVNYAKEMLQRLQVLKDNINDMSEEISGTLKIGVSSNFAQYILPNLLKSFSNKYPKVHFNVSTGLSSDVYRMLNDSSIHIGILRRDYQWHGGRKHLLNRESLYIISQSEIDVMKLPEYKQIDYKTDSSLKGIINHWWLAEFASPANIEMEVDRLETCKELVKSGLGYAIVPEICLKEEDKLYKKEVESKDDLTVKRDTWLMYNADYENLVIVNKFIEHMKSWGNIK
ncbi:MULTISPECIES: LysR family transcriptional regulator [Jeotgalicoccus]|uniref:LysR family transcriptional regulator n=1 Tax=Jeotgalicoccus TaxID=227979 RepID=UPI0030FDB468